MPTHLTSMHTKQEEKRKKKQRGKSTRVAKKKLEKFGKDRPDKNAMNHPRKFAHHNKSKEKSAFYSVPTGNPNTT